MEELAYKVGDKVYLTPKWEVVDVDPKDKVFPYRLKMCNGHTYLWVKGDILSPIKPQEKEK